ncbi:hypothetical protein [Schaalia turicensis]|uniref:hypothetical protein n=1 Tax=Schaalia turicensis TaxID=131111 RepID=UPI001897E26A|nr:hypothetical protein [Schaalia turicensis]
MSPRSFDLGVLRQHRLLPQAGSQKVNNTSWLISRFKLLSGAIATVAGCAVYARVRAEMLGYQTHRSH